MGETKIFRKKTGRVERPDGTLVGGRKSGSSGVTSRNPTAARLQQESNTARMIKSGEISAPDRNIGLPKETISNISTSESTLSGGSNIITAKQQQAKRALQAELLQRSRTGSLPTIRPPKPKSFTDELKSLGKDLVSFDAFDVALGGATAVAVVIPFEGAAGDVLAGSAFVAKTGKKIVKVGRGVVKVGKAAVKSVKAKAVGKFAKDAIVTTAIGQGIVIGTKEIGVQTASESDKRFLQDPIVKQAIGTAFAAEQAAAQKGGFINTVAFEINPALSQNKDVFGATLRKELITQGFGLEGSEKAARAVSRQRKFISAGEAGALIGVSAGVEKIGRGLVVEGLENLARKRGTGAVTGIVKGRVGTELFKVAAPRIAAAGAVEGFGQELAQQQSRNQPFNIKDAGMMAGLGAATAGIIGGGIAATSVTRPTTSKTISFLANIADPFEKPGDIVANVNEAAARKFFGKQTKVPVVSTPISASDQISIGVDTRANVKSQQQATKPKGRTVPVFLPSFNLFPSITPVPSPKNPVPSPSQPFNIVPTIPSQNTPVINPGGLPVTNENVFNEITVNTNTPVNILNVVPTATPLPRIPPPLPFMLPTVGGSKSVKTSNRRVINEFAEGEKVLNKLIGGGYNPFKNAKKTVKKR